MNQILECVPNFSEGRDLSVIEKLCDCFRGKPGVRLLDYTWDQDHNRCVLTIIGEPEPLRDAVVESIGRAVELIDMTKHQGQHPRMGCVDVVPFIPALASPSSSMRSLPRLPTGPIWPMCARASLRAWRKR